MKRLHTRIPASIPSIRLDQFLADWLPTALGLPVSRGKIRTLLFSGGVYVNRHRNKNGMTNLFSGSVIEVYFNEQKFNANQSQRKSDLLFDANRICYEDEWIIVVDKSAGIPTQPTIDPDRANLYDLLKAFLAKRANQEEVYLGLHHRLDRDTSGLVLFTKREEANKGVADLFSKHEIEKSYQCLTLKGPESPVYETNDEFKVENYLGRISEKSKNSKFGSVRSGGDFAETHFKVLKSFFSAYWIEAMPQTGRTHQIRVHTSELGIPILGDPTYFPATIRSLVQVPRLMLHAGRLSFAHPVTHAEMTVTAVLPDEFMQVAGSLR